MAIYSDLNFIYPATIKDRFQIFYTSSDLQQSKDILTNLEKLDIWTFNLLNFFISQSFDTKFDVESLIFCINYLFVAILNF